MILLAIQNSSEKIGLLNSLEAILALRTTDHFRNFFRSNL